MNWRGFGGTVVAVRPRYYPGICLEALRKTSKIFSLKNLCPELDAKLSQNMSAECYPYVSPVGVNIIRLLKGEALCIIYKISRARAYTQDHNIFWKANSERRDAMEGYTYMSKTEHTWLWSASELYRPSDRRLFAKLGPTFVDRWCRVASATDSHGR
jgi:hypothetical protein